MRSVLADVLVAMGTIFFAAGAWFAWHPAGWMVAGLVLVAVGARMERERST